MFKKIQTRKDINLLVEEKFYEHVANELEAGEISKGLWAKASVLANSTDEAEIKPKYIELRVKFLEAGDRLQEHITGQLEGEFAAEATVLEVPPEPELPDLRSDEELMTAYGITFDGEDYHFDKYTYSKFEDAVNYAKLKMPN